MHSMHFTRCLFIHYLYIDSCSTKGIWAKLSIEEPGTFSHITHELPLVLLHPWSLNPGNNSPHQNLSVHVLGSNMDANCFQTPRTRQSNKRNSEKLKLGCEKTHEAQRDILTTIDFNCAGWCDWLQEKRMHLPLNFHFSHIFFWFLWDFWVLNKFQVNIAGVAQVGIDHGGLVVWRRHHPTIRGPSVGHLLVPTCFFFGETFAVDVFLWISRISRIRYVLKLRTKQNHQMMFENSDWTFLRTTYNDLFIVFKDTIFWIHYQTHNTNDDKQVNKPTYKCSKM